MAERIVEVWPGNNWTRLDALEWVEKKLTEIYEREGGKVTAVILKVEEQE